MIRIEGLRFGYYHENVLDIKQLEVAQGQHFLFLGNSGSGKTTLLHVVAGLLRPQQGKITVADQKITRMSSAALDTFRGQHIGLVFQKPHLISALSVYQNLRLAQYMAGLPTDEDRIYEILNDLGLEGKKNARIATLSQGEAQRITIARALLNKPKVIMADEPTSSLDDDNCARVITLLQHQARKYHATLIISTHDQRIKDRIPERWTLDKCTVV